MDPQTLDRDELERACREVVRSTLWQTPNPQDIHDIVDADQIARLTAAYVEEALWHLDFVEGTGRDPNLITRAVRYLAATHAIPPMGEDLAWFHYMLQALVELACPNTGQNRESAAFLADIRAGIEEAEADLE